MDFIEENPHATNYSPVYSPNIKSITRGIHTTSIIGYGTSSNGIPYWLCRGSNMNTKTGKKYTYKIEKKEALYGFGGIHVISKIPFEIDSIRKFRRGCWPKVPDSPQEQVWSSSFGEKNESEV